MQGFHQCSRAHQNHALKLWCMDTPKIGKVSCHIVSDTSLMCKKCVPCLWHVPATSMPYLGHHSCKYPTQKVDMMSEEGIMILSLLVTEVHIHSSLIADKLSHAHTAHQACTHPGTSAQDRHARTHTNIMRWLNFSASKYSLIFPHCRHHCCHHWSLKPSICDPLFDLYFPLSHLFRAAELCHFSILHLPFFFSKLLLLVSLYFYTESPPSHLEILDIHLRNLDITRSMSRSIKKKK